MGHVIKDALFARDFKGAEIAKMKKAEQQANVILTLHRNCDAKTQ